MTQNENLESDAGAARPTSKGSWQSSHKRLFEKILPIVAIPLVLVLVIAVFGRRTFTDSYQVWNYLQLAQRVGRTQAGPVPLPLRINIDNQWEQIVSTVNGAGVALVHINLSRSSMINTEFNPGNTGSGLIRSIVLPNSVTGIARGFGVFPNLSSIRFPASVEIDEVNPFVGLSHATFHPRGSGDLSTIENRRALVRGGNELISFPSASGNVTLDNITTIARSAFNGTTVESIYLPSVSTVGMFAFGNCGSLTTVNLPAAEYIGYGAFLNNTSLQTVSLPAAISIGERAFAGSTSLQTVELPAAIAIGANAFHGNTSLQTLYLPSLVSIGNQAAASTGNTALTITVGEQLETIGTWMFYGVTAAKNVVLRVPQSEVAGITAKINAFRGRGWNEGSFTLATGFNRNTGRTNWEVRGGQWVQVPVMEWVNNFNTHINLTVQGF